MKIKLLLLSLLLTLSVAMPTYGATIVNYTGLGQITYVNADDDNPFDVSVLDFFNWFASYDADIPTVHETVGDIHPGWDVRYFNENSDYNLEIPVGSVYTYDDLNDSDYVPAGGYPGFPALLFDGGVLSGVDALEDIFQLNGLDNRWFGFGTIPDFSDFTNFTLIEYELVREGLVFDKVLVTGDLFVVPEPSTLVLFGMGLMGVLACFRKRAR